MSKSLTPDNSDNFHGNIIRPFQLEASSLRGRIVRFNTVLNDILEPHQYPEAVSQLLGETITLCSLLSSMLKYKGIFTLQTSGDGPISMLVADMTSDGGIRGCATFDEERLEAVTKKRDVIADKMNQGTDSHLIQLLGKGYIAFTVDQGEHAEQYQGIVELKGNTLTECVQHYFTQSEQIDTGIMLAVGQQKGVWRSAGLMLQHMPEDGGASLRVHSDKSNITNLREDDWHRTMTLLGSITNKELLAEDLNSHLILTRLFHEEGVRVFEPTPLTHQCRCSNEKVENMVLMMPQEDRDDIVVDGEIAMTCEFCSKDYILDPAVINKKVKAREKRDAQ